MDLPLQQPVTPDSPNPTPTVSPKRKKSWVKYLILGIIVFAVFIGGSIFTVFGILSEPTKVAEDWLMSIQSESVQTVYDNTAQGFKNVTKIEDLDGYLQKYGELKEVDTVFFSNRQVDNNIATMSGSFKTTDGRKHPVEIQLVKEDEWRVLNIDLRPGE